MQALFPILALVCISLVARNAGAHVVNLSQSDLTVDGATVHALVVLAKPDAVLLGEMDPDRDGIITPAELEASQATFRTLVEREIDVRADGARCAPRLLGGGDVEGDGFGLSVDFACASPPHALSVSMDLLRRLPPAHRHLLRLRAGAVNVETELTPGAPTFELSLADPTAGATGASPRSPLANAIRLGLSHILTGWDHLLFLLALLLGTRGWRPLALAVTAFTLAHSITLALAALDLVTPSPRFVEPAIAASIAYVAFENAFRPGAPHRWRIAFAFGLVHGFGFAAALRAIALDRARLLPALLGFNLGVELGQLAVLAALVPLLALALRNRAPDAAPLRAASVAIGVVGLAVFVARIVSPS